MAKKVMALLFALAMVAAACGGGSDDTVGADGVAEFGAAGPAAVTGTRAMNLGDLRVNVTMEDQWQVGLRESFTIGSAFYVIQPSGTAGTAPALQFLRPTNIVEPTDVTTPLFERPEGGTIDLSEQFDLEAWLAMLPDGAQVGEREATVVAGQDAVTFEFDLGAVCDSDCSFLHVERNESGSGEFSFAGIGGDQVYTVIWADQSPGEFPLVVLSSGDDSFLEQADAVIASAVIGEPATN